MGWKGKFKSIPDEDDIESHFYDKYYSHPLFSEMENLGVMAASRRAEKLWKWLDNRYPCECVSCGGDMDRDDWDPGDTILCDDCGRCESCGEFINNDECYQIGDDGPYCESCYDDKVAKCDDCGAVINCDDATVSNNLALCMDCYTHNYYSCGGCDTLVHTDHAYSLNGCPYCESCYDDGQTDNTSDLPSAGCGSSNQEERHKLEGDMASLVLRYYGNMAFELTYGKAEQFRLTAAEMSTLTKYLVTTASAELRHAPKEGSVSVNDHWCLKVLHKYCDSRTWDRHNSRESVMGSMSIIDMGVNDSIKFLRSAYAVFYDGNWPGSFGGMSWANCCWQSIRLLSALQATNGYADKLLWEVCLNACHNNSTWLNKVSSDGVHYTLRVLHMGAYRRPDEILDIYYADDPLEMLFPCIDVPRPEYDFKRLPDPRDVWVYGDGDEDFNYEPEEEEKEVKQYDYNLTAILAQVMQAPPGMVSYRGA